MSGHSSQVVSIHSLRSLVEPWGRRPTSPHALAERPIIGSRVCQYELTTDTHFRFARHPEQASWWLLGGGSGHGFKHGPALAEYVADCVEGKREPEAFHALGERVGQAGLRTAAAY